MDKIISPCGDDAPAISNDEGMLVLGDQRALSISKHRINMKIMVPY